MYTRILLIILLGGWAHSGKTQNNNALKLETGVSLQAVQDKGHSPLVYKGNALFLGIAQQKQTERKRRNWHLNYTNNGLNPVLEQGINEFNIAERTRINASFEQLYRSRQTTFDLYLGGKVGGNYDFISFNHSANNLVGYELNISLSPSIAASYNLTNWAKVYFEGSMPLLSYSVRPEALGLFPMENFNVNILQILSGGSIASLHNFLNVETRVSVNIDTEKLAFVVFYDYAGGVNNVEERKAFSTSQIGVQLPISINVFKSRNHE